LIKALIQGEGFITIGYNPKGKTMNPIFAINEETSYEGYKIQIPIEKFTNEVKSKIIWALAVSNSQISRLKNLERFPLIESVKHEIENPLKHIYKELYNALEKYNQEGFYVSKDGLENRGTFEVYFCTPGPSGFVKANKKLPSIPPIRLIKRS
jgi:hypothetical protein